MRRTGGWLSVLVAAWSGAAGCGRIGFGDAEEASKVQLSAELLPGVYTVDAKLCVDKAADVQYALTETPWPQGWTAAQFAELAAGAEVLARGTVPEVTSECGKVTLSAAAASDAATVHLYALIDDAEVGGAVTANANTKLHPAWQLHELQCSLDYTMRYWLHHPESYYRDAEKALPTLLFLHGAGSDGNEAGVNIEKLRDFEELPKLYQQRSAVVRDLPFVVYAPQCNADLGGCFGWSNANHLMCLDETLAHVSTKAPVDVRRFYVTGESTGGEGAWRYAMHRSQLVAALVSVASTLLPDDPEPDYYRSRMCSTTQVATWAFHNAGDALQPASNSEYLVNKLADCAPAITPKLTYGDWTFNGSTHAGWVEVYGDTHGGSNGGHTSIYKWLLSHSR